MPTPTPAVQIKMLRHEKRLRNILEEETIQYDRVYQAALHDDLEAKLILDHDIPSSENSTKESNSDEPLSAACIPAFSNYLEDSEESE